MSAWRSAACKIMHEPAGSSRTPDAITLTAMTEPEHPACDSPECVWCQPTLNTPYEPVPRYGEPDGGAR